MRITADTNLLVRIIVNDDTSQARAALRELEAAQMVFIPLPCLCEFVWVLDVAYGYPREQIATSVRAIIERSNVVTDLAVVAIGLRILDAGGDFADGVIAASGTAMGADRFMSFDRKAVARIKAVGLSAEIVSVSS